MINNIKSVNAAIVIIGASGDLARRKLIPALSVLYEQGKIDDNSAVIGTGRSDFSIDEFKNRFSVSDSFRKLLSYHRGIEGTKEYISSIGTFNRIFFFFAIPPSSYLETSEAIYNEGFGKEATIIIEKPFGYDFDSAKSLDTGLKKYFHEDQILRIDHYLAKEAVQNILVFRFTNSIFYSLWNSSHIESIQINASEEIGIGKRGAYFDNAGIIRDMVQNHLTQLLCLITMEAPVSLDSEEIRDQKIDVLKTMRVESCKRFQYRGYREEEGVSKDSDRETYAEMKLFIDNFRWTGMPIYLRAGKALDRTGTEIAVVFKKPPRLLFNRDGKISRNRIVFTIQPHAGIIMDISGKLPGDKTVVTNTNLSFCYHKSFNDTKIPEAYQKLLFDALKCDRTLYLSSLETELSWKTFGPILDKGDLEYYDRNSFPSPVFTDDWVDFSNYQQICREQL